MKQRQQVAVGGAIFNHLGEILMVRRIANDEFMPGAWELPGGGTEFGEKPEEGLKREILEECGVEITVGRPITVKDYYIERNGERVQRVEIVFHCQLLPNQKTVTLSDEHDQFSWRKLTNLDDLKMTDFMSDVLNLVRKFLS